MQVVLSEETEIGRLLRSHSSDLPTMVAAIIEGKFQPAALGQLVSSQLDVDRMEYFLRFINDGRQVWHLRSRMDH